jgi:hypothetical protein
LTGPSQLQGASKFLTLLGWRVSHK